MVDPRPARAVAARSGSVWVDGTSGSAAPRSRRVIKGKDAVHSVQYARWSVPTDPEHGDAMHRLGKITVRHARPPAHACPSVESLAPAR